MAQLDLNRLRVSVAVVGSAMLGVGFRHGLGGLRLGVQTCFVVGAGCWVSGFRAQSFVCGVQVSGLKALGSDGTCFGFTDLI